MTGASVRRAIMVGVDLSGASLQDVDLSDVLNAPPSTVYIDDKPLFEVIAEHEQFCATEGKEGGFADLSDIDFRPLKQLRKRRLSGLMAPKGIFFGMNLEGSQLQGADLRAADLRGCNLRGCDLRGAKLTDAQLARADLRDAKLGPLPILRTDLTRANLRFADLRYASLVNARFFEADMAQAKLDSADLRGAEMEVLASA
jgi:uncharacterized protein YjbI with pentapeptide repeats